VAVAGLVLGCFVAIQWVLDRGVTVSVINETGAALDQVRLTFTGGDCRAERIEAGGREIWAVSPWGESGITLAFRDAKGDHVVVNGELYIEGGYRGSVEFHVGPGGTKVIDRTRPGPF
jgi:hypothetical protein